jgi:hypothetical protein
MEGGAELLDRLGIPRSERILIAEEDAPNLGLVHFDRKGIHNSEGRYGPGFESYGRGFEAAYNISKDHGIRFIVLKRGAYDRARNAPDSAFGRHFELLTPEGEKVVLRRKD